MLEGGLSRLSASAIATRAGVNKALVFYYFESVSELVNEVLARYYDRHRVALEEAFDTEGTVRERLVSFVERYFDWMTDNRAYARIIQEHVARGGEHAALVSAHTRGLVEVTEARMAKLLPAEGPLSTKHFYLSLSAATINYFTYAPVIADRWGGDPFSDHALAERREHLRWIIEAWADKLGL